MTASKRSLEAMLDSDDEDEPSLGRQTLPVANLPETFDGEPMNGLQYLWTVRRDAKRLPFYTRVENPYEQAPTRPAAKKTPAVSKSRVALPSEEWRAVFIRRFRNFRKNSAQPTIGTNFPFLPGQLKLMPEKKERDKWWAFINGRPECEWNPPKVPKKSWRESSRQHIHVDHAVVDDIGQYEVPITESIEEDTIVPQEVLVVTEFGDVADGEGEQIGTSENVESEAEGVAGSLPTPFATPQPEERYKASESRPKHTSGGARHPTPTLLKPMDSRYCIHLLMYFTYWITQHLELLESGQASTSPFSHLSQNHARWMFALLSRVDEYLTSDELSTLRGLARACIAFIKDLSKNNSVESGENVGGALSGVRWIGDPADAPLDERACWMVVAIITEFWGQKDLWMDAEGALNGPWI